MMRVAQAGDAPRIDRFLEPYTDTSMFLRGNLKRHGLFEREHPHGTQYYLTEHDGEITGVFGCTNGGYLMCQAPRARAEDWLQFAHTLRGKTVWGMTGVADQVEATLNALGLRPDGFALNHLEPLYRLNLKDLPDFPELHIRRVTLEDRDLLTQWFIGYTRDTEPTRTPSDIKAQAQALVDRALTTNDTRVLIEDGAPCAMTAINTRVGNTVQVSGVYVPPQLRGQGRGGQVVAAHLSVLRTESDIGKAILFAFSSPAARTYEKIGFRKIGEVRIARLIEPRVIREIVT